MDNNTRITCLTHPFNPVPTAEFTIKIDIFEENSSRERACSAVLFVEPAFLTRRKQVRYFYIEKIISLLMRRPWMRIQSCRQRSRQCRCLEDMMKLQDLPPERSRTGQAAYVGCSRFRKATRVCLRTAQDGRSYRHGYVWKHGPNGCFLNVILRYRVGCLVG